MGSFQRHAWSGRIALYQPITSPGLRVSLGRVYRTAFDRFEETKYSPALMAPILILGFIFYADTAAASLADWNPTMKKVPRPMLTGFVSILPLMLAMVMAVAVSRLAPFG